MPGDLGNVYYAVFGCGHRDWHSTFHKIPKLTDSLLEERGAHRLTSRGASDVATGDIWENFDEWADESLWPAILQSSEATKLVQMGLPVWILRSSRIHDLLTCV